MSENRVDATNGLEICFYCHSQKFRTTTWKVKLFVLTGYMRLTYLFVSLLQSLLFAKKRHEYNLIHDFYTYADV